MRYDKAIEILKARALDLGTSQAEIARGSNLSPSQVSRIFNFESTPSQEALVSIAVFLKIPPEHILRASELLQAKSSNDELVERAEHLLSTFKYPETRQKALEYLEFLSIQEGRGEYNAKASRPATSEQG